MPPNSYGVDMARVGCLDALRHGGHRRVIAGIPPPLIIVPAHPGDFVKMSVPIPEIISVVITSLGTIVDHIGQPSAGLDRVEENREVVLRRQADHLVATREKGLVRLGEVEMREIMAARQVSRERKYPIEGAAVRPSAGIDGADQVIHMVLNPWA